MDAKKIQAKIQKFGATLSAMVMPNIGVFIGWGILTALFIDTGWVPSKYWNQLVSPTLTYLLPILIGYTAGSNIYGRRGGVIGAFATVGMVVGSSVTMLIGGMIMGPIGAVLIRKFDKMVEGKVKAGLEMLVDNFSLGIIGVILCMIGYAAAAPAMTAIQNVLSAGVNFLCDKGLIPLTAIFVQPAQILFLNNAINHGIMVPLGLQQAAEVGKSVLFLVEANGAIWVGLAAAFAVFGNKEARKSAPGAVIIMFFGGIAEVCFPYCLMMPITILGPIIGNMFSLFILSSFGGGTVGPPSPGSVFAFYLMTPKSSMLVNTIAYFGSMVITFAVTGLILKLFGDHKKEVEQETAIEAGKNAQPTVQIEGKINSLDKVIFACDAGMGSSAMGVTILKKELEKAGLYPEIHHVAVKDIPMDANVIVTNENLAERAAMTTKNQIPIITINNFMDKNEYDHIVKEMQNMMEDNEKEIFPDKNIILNAKFRTKKEAIEACADIFIKGGYTDEGYKADMIKRDEEASVYLGNGVALPHGVAESKKTIKNSGICLIQVPEGVDFDGEMAYILVGVAGKGDEHIELLGKIGTTLLDEEILNQLKVVKDKNEVHKLLGM